MRIIGMFVLVCWALGVTGAWAQARVTDGLVVLYEFNEGAAMTVTDTSGIGTPVQLLIDDPAAVTWINGGLRVHQETIISSVSPPTKVYTALMASNTLTIEAWVKPVNTTQAGPARIVSLSSSPFLRNATLAQVSTGVEARMRSLTTDSNGLPALITAGGTVETTLQHLVMTRDAQGSARLYIDGIQAAVAANSGAFSNWDTSMPLLLSNEFNSGINEREWLGEYHLVAIYSTALTAAQVTQNFEAGPAGTGVLPPQLVTKVFWDPNPPGDNVTHYTACFSQVGQALGCSDTPQTTLWLADHQPQLPMDIPITAWVTATNVNGTSGQSETVTFTLTAMNGVPGIVTGVMIGSGPPPTPPTGTP